MNRHRAHEQASLLMWRACTYTCVCRLQPRSRQARRPRTHRQSTRLLSLRPRRPKFLHPRPLSTQLTLRLLSLRPRRPKFLHPRPLSTRPRCRPRFRPRPRLTLLPSTALGMHTWMWMSHAYTHRYPTPSPTLDPTDTPTLAPTPTPTEVPHARNLLCRRI